MSVPPPTNQYEWIRWLSGTNAQVLLLNLCSHIDDASVTREALQTLIAGWRANAHKPLGDDSWLATVDTYLEVHVHARLYYFSHEQQESTS